MQLSVDDLKKAIYGAEYEILIPDLLAGITKDELEKRIAEIKNVSVDHPSVPIARMNVVGGLRNWGYIVTGGRSDRKAPYKVIDWVEKKEKQIAKMWSGLPRRRLDWVESLPRLVETDEDRVRSSLSTRPESDKLHECSWLYPWCYELARDRAWWVDSSMLIMARFESYPRFRIFNLNATTPDLLVVACFIAPASCKPVYIVNPSLQQLKDLKRWHPDGTFGKRLQAIYRTEDIALHPEKFFNERALTLLRSNSKQLHYVESPSGRSQAAIISEWRRINEPKQRQLAITRDFVAIQSKTVHKIVLVGERDDKPACMHILDPLANRSDTVAQIVEKSLNYTTQVGGRPGTADWNLVMTCRYLLEHDYKYLNAGGFDGGGYGLPAHKRRFARIEDDIASQAFYTSFPYHKDDGYVNTQLPDIGE